MIQSKKTYRNTDIVTWISTKALYNPILQILHLCTWSFALILLAFVFVLFRIRDRNDHLIVRTLLDAISPIAPFEIL